jgi:hypothetical protein
MNSNGNGKIEILIDQVGRLTESVTELRIVTEQQTQAIQTQSELIKRLYDSHDQTINRLVTIVETLIQQQSKQ